MKIKSLELLSYRNYPNQTINFSGGLNVLHGSNAQGKTNLLESIYFCAIGKSTRVSKEREVILWGKDEAKIKLISQKKYNNSTIEIYFSKKQNKSIKINGISIKKIGELMGEFNAVYFSPDELKLVKECPEDRRRFMDISIAQTSKTYFYLLNRYEKVLANRNKLLKTYTDINNIKDVIGVWNEQLADIGSKIISARIGFLTKLSSYAKLAHNYLTSEKEDLKLSYSGIVKESVEKIKEEILNKLEKNIEKDFSLGYTTIGPHRDDIKIFVNDIDIKTYGSQGQQRTCALSLKLAELEIIKEQTGEYPVLLLDDVLSELDYARRKKLLNFTQKTQTILTCNEFDYDIPCTKFKIENGEIK